MKKGDLKYYLILASVFIAFVLYQIFGPKPFDWTPTLRSDDKNPFGTYVLNESLPDIFTKGIDKSFFTLYELRDSTFNNMFILTNTFVPGEEDLNTLLERASQGDKILISAFDFSYDLKDTLGFDVTDVELSMELMDENLSDDDSLSIHLLYPDLESGKYTFPVINTYNQLEITDSSRVSALAVNNFGNPVLLNIAFGEGAILINCTPLIFTNHFILQDQNSHLSEGIFSYLPDEKIHWTEYYTSGRMENQSPLRYLLSQESLSWAYYLVLAGLILFILFEAKRRQRIIPVISPLRNSTLDFVRTISNLYFEHKDHKNIADKRISYFLEKLRRAYFLPEHLQGKALYEKVAAKSGHSLEEVEVLFNTMYDIRTRTEIPEEELKKLNSLIENFRI